MGQEANTIIVESDTHGVGHAVFERPLEVTHDCKDGTLLNVTYHEHEMPGGTLRGYTVEIIVVPEWLRRLLLP